MKTKISISQTELLDTLSRAYGFKVDEVLITTEKTESLADKLSVIIKEFPDYRATQKIAAIKRLLELKRDSSEYMPLANAKWAVENWEKFINFVRKENRLPNQDDIRYLEVQK